MIDRETVYEMFEAMEETNEGINELEEVFGGIALEGRIFASFNYMPTWLERIVFPKGASDDTLDKFYEDFWRVVDGYLSEEEFCDRYAITGEDRYALTPEEETREAIRRGEVSYSWDEETNSWRYKIKEG